MSDTSSKQPSHIAYSVVHDKNDQSHWNKIGAAWPVKNDGLSLQLDSLPLNGKIVLRSREELETLREQRHEKTQDQSQEQTIHP